MIEGTTSTGFEYSINEKAMRDWSYVEHLKKVQELSKKKSPDPIEAFSEFGWMLKFMLGAKEKDRLIDHIRERNDGFAPVEAVMAEWREMVQNEKIKNSSSSPG